jgi:hypothetical protein
LDPEALNAQKEDSLFPQLVLLFVISRVVLEIVGFLSMFYFPSARQLFRIRDFNYHRPQPRAIEMWARWDSEWYLLIAEQGYYPVQYFRNEPRGDYLPRATARIFPLYPWLIRILTTFTQNAVIAGIIISNTCSLLFLYYLFRLARKLYSPSIAFSCCLFAIFFPTSFFLNAVYAESLFLACICAAFLYIEEQRIVPAAIASALLMLTRPQGWLAIPAILLLGYLKSSDKRIRNVFILSSAITLTCGFHMLFIMKTFGSLVDLTLIPNLWRGEMKYPLYAIVRFFSNDIAVHGEHNSMIDFSFAVLHLGIAVVSFRKLPFPYYLYSIIVILYPLSSSLFSFSRLCLANIPFFLYLGQQLQGRLAFSVQTASAMLMAFFMAAFANWFWVG